MLPNGAYKFETDDYGYTATVAGAKTTATAAKKYLFTFADIDGAGGSVTKKVPTGWTLAAPDVPERDGYAFAGWKPALPSTAPAAATTYTAQWERTAPVEQYTITFEMDGGGETEERTFECGAAVAASATLPAPEKEGYVFAGWEPELPETMPAENLSVKATWRLAPYFRLESVTANAEGKVSVVYDSYDTDLSGGDWTLTVADADGATVATVTEWEVAPEASAGRHTAVWDARAFIATLDGAADFTFSLAVGAEAEAKYLVIDLADASRTYLADVPEGGWTDEYKTAKLVLRKIIGAGETATFTMGSPASEAGRTANETQHGVTLTEPYWMGVFEFTQGQWAAVKGSAPSCKFSGATRPVENVAWADLKGAITSYGATSATGSSFIGALRTRTGSDLGLNLPTEAEWEYACRAGTAGAFNTDGDCAVRGDETAAAGTLAPNAWGLYDMHGNVREWCHDASAERTADATDLGAAAATDPTGTDSGATTPYRLVRGGGYASAEADCRSARRTAWPQASGTYISSPQPDIGFRIAARGFAGESKVGSFVAAAGTVTATLGRSASVGAGALKRDEASGEAEEFKGLSIDIEPKGEGKIAVVTGIRVALEEGVDFAEWVEATNKAGKFKVRCAATADALDEVATSATLPATGTVADAAEGTVSLAFEAEVENVMFFRAVIEE